MPECQTRTLRQYLSLQMLHDRKRVALLLTTVLKTGMTCITFSKIFQAALTMNVLSV